jgi:hypothetical protein
VVHPELEMGLAKLDNLVVDGIKITTKIKANSPKA